MRFQKGSSASLLQQKNQQTFFNQSFYRQKLLTGENGHSYSSYEFVKRYFQATKMNLLINKTVKTTLQSSHLPQNPYNMIGRLLLHEAIFQNTKVYYTLEDRSKNRPNSGQMGLQLSINEAASHRNVMADINFRGITLTAGWKIRNLIKEDRLKFLWDFLIPAAKKENNINNKSGSGTKTKIMNISHCLGGSLLLKTGCPYSAEQSVIPYELIFTQPTDNGQHLSQFGNHVINSCIKICETPDIIFIKLKFETYSPVAMEWSIDNIVNNKTKIIKEIIKKCLALPFTSIKAEYLVRLPSEGQKIIGTSHLRVNKTFVLIQQEKKSARIHSICPATILLTSVFPANSIFFQVVLKSFDEKSTAEELVHELQEQMHRYMVYGIEEQQQSWVGWSLFYLHLYEFKQKKEKDKQLLTAINYMIRSPLSFLDEILHEVNVAKLISGRYSISHNETQIYELLEKINKKIWINLHQEQHVYPEAVLFFQAAKKNIELILEMKKGKTHNIRPILQRIQLMIMYLRASFNQIIFVLKGHLLNEIVRVDNEFGKEGSGQIITKTVTYDIFLRKYKNLPDRNLNINEEVKKLRDVFNRPDQDIKEMILAKYVKNYQLYEKIYGFYWGIICGKKLNYPMSRFVNLLRNQAIKFQSVKQGEKNFNLDLQEHRADGIMIYQKSADAQGQHVFYALAPACLQDQKVRDYKTIFEVFSEHFQSDIVTKNSVKSMGEIKSCSYLVSVNTNVNRGKWQQSDFNKCKIYVDVIYNYPINRQQTHRIMFQQIKRKLETLTKQGFGVIGLYIGEPEYIDEDLVYPWTQQQQKFDLQFLRFYSKRSLQYEPVAKLLLNCMKNNQEVIVRCVFWLNGLLKSCTISFNFLINQQWLLNRSHTYQDRVFRRYDDVIRWGNYNGLKKYIASRKEIEGSASFDKIASTKQLYMNNHIDMIKFVAEGSEQNLNIRKVRSYSPFYSMLEQALSLSESLFFLLQFLKTDRQGRFDIKDFKQTIQLLQYYLFDKCLRSDRYIYSEGLSVTIINFVGRINSYIDEHPDNNGEEKQLIYLQKITVRLMNCIHYSLTSCAFGVIEAIQSDFVDLDQYDD